MIMGRHANFLAGAELHVFPARHVDSILINVPDDACSDSAINSTKRMLEAANPINVILDSGGFQLHVGERDGKKISFDESIPLIRNKLEINIAPVHVMEAAAIIRPDIVVGLDFPIKKNRPKRTRTGIYAQAGIQRSLDQRVLRSLEKAMSGCTIFCANPVLRSGPT